MAKMVSPCEPFLTRAHGTIKFGRLAARRRNIIIETIFVQLAFESDRSFGAATPATHSNAENANMHSSVQQMFVVNLSSRG